jgi:hypothetical protein
MTFLLFSWKRPVYVLLEQFSKVKPEHFFTVARKSVLVSLQYSIFGLGKMVDKSSKVGIAGLLAIAAIVPAW